MPVLKIENVTKSFFQAQQKVDVLKEINCEIQKGEVVALMGPSGSGKTTLLQIAGLLDNPTSGFVSINNNRVENSDDQTRTEIRKKNIGFVYQFHHLLPEFSAVENVAMPMMIQGINKKIALENAAKLLDQVELLSHINHQPSQLSGGQQQRVAIARAIANKPSLILADEPTGNLDSELSEKIFQLFLDLARTHQISCIMATHNHELAKKTDRIINIKNGKI